MITYGAPYPITPNPLGFLYSAEGLDVIKADLLQLLMTNPKERVMLADYGTPLRQFLFEPNDTVVADQIKQIISNSITKWEPRITVDAINVYTSGFENALIPNDNLNETGSSLFIDISFFDPDNIANVQNLTLEMPIQIGV